MISINNTPNRVYDLIYGYSQVYAGKFDHAYQQAFYPLGISSNELIVSGATAADTAILCQFWKYV
jgi:hypothetical protein